MEIFAGRGLSGAEAAARMLKARRILMQEFG
jgi:hypothetical protein